MRSGESIVITSISMSARIASCGCGQLQARVSAEPLRVSVCHGLAGQRRTGSVFGAQARFAREAVSISGTRTEFVRVGDEGTKATFRFCPNCGVTVYYSMSGVEDAVAIPAGALDSSFPAPTCSVYEERMHGRVHLSGGIEHVA